MSGRRPPSKPEIPETPFRDTHAIPPTEGLAAGGRLSHRESDKWAKHPPILEDQEHHQQEAEKSLQYISSRDSERPRETKSQLGSRESNRTPEYPSRDSRGSSANSRCPFLPCPGCIEKCLDTQDEQQHYRPSWVRFAYIRPLALLLRGAYPCHSKPSPSLLSNPYCLLSKQTACTLTGVFMRVIQCMATQEAYLSST